MPRAPIHDVARWHPAGKCRHGRPIAQDGELIVPRPDDRVGSEDVIEHPAETVYEPRLVVPVVHDEHAAGCEVIANRSKRLLRVQERLEPKIARPHG